MNPHRWQARALVALALFGTAAAAGACDFTWDDKWKIWRGNCSLAIGNGPKLETTVLVDRVKLKMPDLKIDRISVTKFGNSAEITAYIENIGTHSSGATTVALSVTVTDPANPHAPVTSTVGPAGVPSLLPSARQGVFVGSVTANTSMSDLDLTITGMVDPLTAAQPVRGAILESVESNNSLVFMCRLFGPPAAPGLPGC